MVIHIYDGGGREGACNGASPRCSMSMEEHVSLTSKCAEISCLGNNWWSMRFLGYGVGKPQFESRIFMIFSHWKNWACTSLGIPLATAVGVLGMELLELGVEHLVMDCNWDAISFKSMLGIWSWLRCFVVRDIWHNLWTVGRSDGASGPKDVIIIRFSGRCKAIGSALRISVNSAT